MSYEGIETIVWDLDGTLLDSFGVYSEILRDVLPQLELPMPEEKVLLRNYHGSLDESIGNALGVVDQDDLSRIVTAFLESQEGHYQDVESHLFSDALSLAHRANEENIKQIIVTNRDHDGRGRASPREIVRRSSLVHLIDGVICGDDGPHRKPLVEVFSGNEPPAESTLVIGDQYVDIMLAHNLGARALIVNRGSETLQHLDKLHDTWEDHTTVVTSLGEVSFN